VSALIEARGVSKMFGQVRALNDVDLEIGPGVTGLLGPNGSGKSTLMKLIAGQLLPETGTVRLMGRDPFRDPHALRNLGLCPEQDKFYEDLTGREFVTALTRLGGFPAREAQARADAALERVGMARDGQKRMRAMSRGMRQRVKIAQAIAHDPQVVLLDEPLNGADPVARADLIALVRRLGEEGRCVVISSHVLHEVEAMTHRVIFIRFGRLRAYGDVLRLRTALEDRPYRIRIAVDRPREVAGRLMRLPHVRKTELVDEETLELTTTDLDAAAFDIPAAAEALGMVVRRFTSPDADLESLYRYLIQS
jgi:ABC-2 type transport system ATP-binding protein